MPYLKRHLTQTIVRAAATFPAVLVTGARQTGKTTLLRREFGASHRYLSLERPDIRARAQADPIAFLAEAAPPAILDEIQYAPDLLHYIKEDIDANRFPGRWLLTGSQHFALMHGLSQTLSGRVAVLTLDPLSTAEVGQQPAPSNIDALRVLYTFCHGIYIFYVIDCASTGEKYTDIKYIIPIKTGLKYKFINYCF